MRYNHSVKASYVTCGHVLGTFNVSVTVREGSHWITESTRLHQNISFWSVRRLMNHDYQMRITKAANSRMFTQHISKF